MRCVDCNELTEYVRDGMSICKKCFNKDRESWEHWE